MKKLPLKANAIVKSECWTYYKMAIIQTLPNYRAWLAVNMKSFIEGNGHASYGNNGEWYHLSDFSSILDIKEKMYDSISDDKIIEFIVSEIDKGNYIVIYTNYRALYGDNESEPCFHETLIYGYDLDKRILFSPELYNRKFIESSITFDNFKQAYKQAKIYYLNNPQEQFNNERYFYNITVIKPKYNYSPTNIYFEYYSRLEREYDGGQIYINRPVGYCEYSLVSCYFFGIIAQLELLEKIKLYTQEDKNKHNVRYVLIKQAVIHLSEAIAIFYEGMLWFIEDRKLSNDVEIKEILAGYENLIERKKTDALLMEKHSITKDDSILLRIINHIEENYKYEKELLGKYLSCVKKECIARYTNSF